MTQAARVQREWSTAPDRLTGDLRWLSTIGMRRQGVDAEILSRIDGAESERQRSVPDYGIESRRRDYR